MSRLVEHSNLNYYISRKKHKVNNSRAKRRQKGKQNEAETGLIVALLHDSAKQST